MRLYISTQSSTFQHVDVLPFTLLSHDEPYNRLQIAIIPTRVYLGCESNRNRQNEVQSLRVAADSKQRCLLLIIYRQLKKEIVRKAGKSTTVCSTEVNIYHLRVHMWHDSFLHSQILANINPIEASSLLHCNDSARGFCVG